MKKEQSHINKDNGPASTKISSLGGPASTRRSSLGGFSLVELLVAISIFLIFVISTNTVIQSTSLAARNSANRERATMLNEEGIEAVNNIRNADFANLADGTYGLSTVGDIWSFAGASDITDIFTRSITISTINENQKKVDASVSWADQTSPTNSVVASTYFTNWRELLNVEVGLTVNKTVINHGGVKVAADFAPYKASTTVLAGDPPEPTEVEFPITIGEVNLLNEGTYTITETPDGDYDQSFSGDCNGSGVINLVANTVNTCVITNEEKPSKLQVDKIVINHGGSKVASDFTLLVDSNPVVSGVLNTFNSGVHTVGEVADPSYASTISGDCSPLGSVTLSPGVTKNCTVTNEEYLAPTVTTTTPVESITQTTAVGGGNTTSDGGTTVTVSGLVWSTNINPTTADSKTTDGWALGGPWISTMTSLSCGTLYHVRAYATNIIGTSYGSDVTFTTSACNVIPTVTNPTSTSITSTSATLGATVTSLGIPATLTARGICYNTAGSPTLTNGATCVTATLTQTLTAYTVNVIGLIPGTTYKFAGYATNATGTAYSADGTFTTLSGACAVTGITPTNYDNSGSTSATVAKPTGVVQNDIMFAYIMHNNATDRLNTIPTGWTQIGRHKNGSSNQALYYKVAGASEPTDYTFGLSSSSRFAITINAYRGCFNTVTPIDVSSNTEYVVNNTTYRAASMTLSSAYTTIIIFPSVNTTGAKTFAAPLTQGGGWTEDYANGNSSSRFSRNAYSKLMTSSGATGVIDSIGFSASTVKHAFGVALKPF